MLANVNRWRDQLNLPPVEEKDLKQLIQHIKANGNNFLVVDLVSQTPLTDSKDKIRFLVAILNYRENSWFIKMTGEDHLVASQKEAFLNFLRSLSIP